MGSFFVEKINPKIQKQLDEIIETGNVPDFYNLGPIDFLGYSEQNDFNNFIVRDFYSKNISWCLVNNLWIKDLANFLKDSKVVELYAGHGLISKLLKDQGIDISAYDDFSWNYHKTFTEVINLDAISATKSFPKNSIDFVLMSWIPCGDEQCVEVLKILKENQPNCTIIYIGENYGGCCADDEFFEMLDLEFSFELNNNFQQFYGFHDQIYVGKIKEENF